MPKILNLDKLDTKPSRFLNLGGVDHAIHEMTVENFITTNRAVSALNTVDANPADQIVAMIDMICRSVPTLDRKLLEGRSLSAISTIAEFVRGEEVQEAEERAEGDEQGK